MNALMRCPMTLSGVVLVALSLVVFAGCRSTSDGCSGGCCRGSSTAPSSVPANPTPATVRVAGGAVAALPGQNAAALSPRPYGGQKTCPVTGEELGSMGRPIPVTVRGQTVYVCCRGCAARLQRDPDAYLAKVTAERTGSQ